MRKARSYLVVLLFLFFDCSRSEITPSENDEYNLMGTTPIDNSVIKKMEGVYKLTSGSEGLGSQFVCKTSKSRVSFFSNQSGIFIILKYGYNSSEGSIQFSGFWRYSESSAQGTFNGSILSADGASDLLNGIVDGLKLSGSFPDSCTIQYDHAFSDYAINNPFVIFGHHGVQTTANPPFAENSINAVLNAEDYGCNGLEFDVRMTSDHVPICIHDPGINTRLTQKGPLSGNWDQYPFSYISQYVRLIDGQKIPSVEQALDAFIDSTTMKYFWMDIKGDPDIFQYLEPIVRNAYSRAEAEGRDVVIFAGLPSDDVIAELNAQPTYKATNTAYSYSQPLPTLAEESLDKTLQTGSQFFGPRYTLGLLLDDAEQAHNNGIKVISWTLNSSQLISEYLQDGKFDGFITDYPAYVVYDYYTMF